MSITQQQVAQAQAALQPIESSLSTLANFVEGISTLLKNNWQVTNVIGGVTFTTVINATDQANIIAQYQTCKTDLMNKFNALP